MGAVQPAGRLSGARPYQVPRHPAPIELDLRGNECAPCVGDLRAVLDGAPPLWRYPDRQRLESLLARRFGVELEQVLVTAGADDAIDRLCRSVLEPGRELVLPTPAFEMTRRYARLAGGTVVTVPWTGSDFPVAAVCDALSECTRLVALTSPNNPTGAVIDADALTLIARRALAVGAVVLLDHAYVEFSGCDLTPLALTLPNVVVARTVSKAWGLAGLRVGYAMGPSEVMDWMRSVGAPYAVSSLSLSVAECALQRNEAQMLRAAAVAKQRRESIASALRDIDCDVVEGEANFVFARTPRRSWIADGLAGLGIGVRTFPDAVGLDDALRVGCPQTDGGTERVVSGLHSVAQPEAILFDMDGVLVDVTESYRRAIIGTAQVFGVTVTPSQIAEAKARGDANNDWELTRRLLRAAGVAVALSEVTRVFERLYQGDASSSGLWSREQALVCDELLERLAVRCRLAVVTGRPRADAERALTRFGWTRLFDVCVCMEDAPAKPSPAPVQRALRLLGVSHAWMVGDTPDDVRAARAAGVVPLAALAPGESARAALLQAGASRVLSNLEELEGLLP